MKDVWSRRFTFVLALWAAAITTFVTAVVFIAPPDIPLGTATAYATFIGGPLAAGFLMYRWARAPKEKGDGTGTE